MGAGGLKHGRIGPLAFALATLVAIVAAIPARGQNPTPPGPEFDGLPAEYASAFAAKEVCSRVFVAGGDPNAIIADARIALSLLAPGFVADAASVAIDPEARTVAVTMPGYQTRRAGWAKSQGCVILPAYSERLHFSPRTIPWRGPPAHRRWPLGERLWQGRSSIDRAALDAALAEYMQSEGTRAVVVVHEGELVGERYAPGFGRFTPQRAWSASKSITATLAGLLVDQGKLNLAERAPIREWAGDARREITLRNLLNMSAGLRQNQFEGSTATAPLTFTPQNGHSFIYFDGFDTYADALDSPLEVPPDTRWQYRNANVLAVAVSVLRALPGKSATRLSRFAQHELLEPLGMRTTTLETDPYGHYIASGTTYTTARDLARLGLLHLNGGKLAGARIISRRWARFIRTPSPAYSGYGGLWWLNRGQVHLPGVPETSYFASGAFGQIALVIPSHDLVIARMGFTFPDDPQIDEFARAVIAAVQAGGERAARAPADRPERRSRAVALVANAEGGTVSVVDARRLRVLRTIDVLPDGATASPSDDPMQALVGQQLVELAGGTNLVQDQDVSPDGRRLYVSRGHRGDVAAIRLATGKLEWKTSVEGLRADHMTLSENGDRLYVSDMTANLVHALDARTGEIVGSFAAGDWPHDNHLSHDGELLYNASLGNILLPEEIRAGRPASYRLTVVDARTLEEQRSYEFPRGIRPFVFSEDERRIFAQLSHVHGIVEFDLEQGEIGRRLELPIDPGVTDEDFDFEAPHHGLDISGDGRTLCAAGRASDYVALVSTKRLRPRAVIEVGDAPGWAATGPGGRRCFVPNTREDTLSVISYGKREELARIAVGDGPKHVESARLPERLVCSWPRVPGC